MQGYNGSAFNKNDDWLAACPVCHGFRTGMRLPSPQCPADSAIRCGIRNPVWRHPQATADPRTADLLPAKSGELVHLGAGTGPPWVGMGKQSNLDEKVQIHSLCSILKGSLLPSRVHHFLYLNSR